MQGVLEFCDQPIVVGPPRPAILLDRDGTLIEDMHHLDDPAKVRLLPGVAATLRTLQAAGFELAVVSNQSGVARGLVSEQALHEVHRALGDALGAEQVDLAGAWYCLHGPDAGCVCRKPRPGLLQRAAQRLNLNLLESWMIGDRGSDLLAGRAAGCRVRHASELSGILECVEAKR